MNKKISKKMKNVSHFHKETEYWHIYFMNLPDIYFCFMHNQVTGCVFLFYIIRILTVLFKSSSYFFSILQERNQETRAIVTESVALHRLVQDISALVDEQGEALQVVEANVDKSLEKVVAGNVELQIAEKYVSSYRKKCLFFWILVVVLAVCIGVPVGLHFCGTTCKISV